MICDITNNENIGKKQCCKVFRSKEHRTLHKTISIFNDIETNPGGRKTVTGSYFIKEVYNYLILKLESNAPRIGPLFTKVLFR